MCFSTAAEHRAAMRHRLVSNSDRIRREQRIRSRDSHQGVRNPLSVYDDRQQLKPDRSDAMEGDCRVWPQSAFKAKWPGAAETSIDKPNDRNGNRIFWATADYVRVS